MFLVCDNFMHLRRLLFSWSYDQENDTLPIDFLGGTQILLHRLQANSAYLGWPKPVFRTVTYI